MTQPRIDWRKLLRLFLLVLVLPVVVAFSLDFVVGTTPILTIVAVALFIPLATVLVNRTALQEMDRIIEVVAPPESDDPVAQEETTESGSELPAEVVPSASAPMTPAQDG